jgi:hypothetical protein
MHTFFIRKSAFVLLRRKDNSREILKMNESQRKREIQCNEFRLVLVYSVMLSVRDNIDIVQEVETGMSHNQVKTMH